MKLIVTDMGPIDRHAPGDDVTGFYDNETAARLIGEGYLIDADVKAEVDDKPKRSRKRKVSGNDGGN
jgi:hypothetical protein